MDSGHNSRSRPQATAVVQGRLKAFGVVGIVFHVATAIELQIYHGLSHDLGL